MKDRAYLVLQIIALTVLFVIVLWSFSHTDWEYVCTSPWRFTKPYLASCILRGYPLLP